MLHRMAADTDADREVVEEDQLVTRERTRVIRCLSRRSEWQNVTHCPHCDPRGAASIRLPAAERSGARELQRIGSLQLCSLHDIVDRSETIPAPRCLQRLERFLAQPADVPPAYSERRPLRILRRLGSTLPVAVTHAGRKNFETMTPRVVDQSRRWIESHRPGPEQSSVKLRRVVCVELC